MTENLGQHYTTLFNELLVELAQRLQSYLTDCVVEIPHVDAVVSRAKSPERFALKALKQTNGMPKYSDPINEIQDLVGARITVLYLRDIEPVKKAINDYFSAIEWESKAPDSDSEFGYLGDHFILPVPDDVIPEGREDWAPKFFELQIKTLFQHAWSEASHDIGYKASKETTALQRRQMAFSAAQAWGADQIFDSLASELNAGGGVH